jgi:hypothetical protein
MLFQVYGSVHHNIFYEITNRCSYMQSILFHCQVHSTRFGCFIHPSSGVQFLTVSTATGANHSIVSATYSQCGLVLTVSKSYNIVKEDITSEWESTTASPTSLYIATFQLCGTIFAELKTAKLACHISTVFYAFFWVIPQRLNFICRHFGTLCLSHLHRQVVVEWLGWEMLGYLYGKIFGSKIAWANRKESDPPDERSVKKVFNVLKGKRSVGKPRKRWLEMLKIIWRKWVSSGN